MAGVTFTDQMEPFNAMDSWKGFYRNVDELQHGEEQRSQPDTMMSVDWSEYEEIDPAAKRKGKQMETGSSAWKAHCTQKTVVVCGAAVLATSVFLNVLLLALGIVHYSKTDSTLEQMSTENKLPEDKTAACIPSAWDWLFIQDSYYFLSHSPGTWDVANQSCTSMESHLVMISSTEEKDHIADIMKASSSWIGLTDHMLDGDWKWVDGTRVGLDNKSYWQQGEPNGGKAENCVLMMKDSFWYDFPCTETHHWICERKH